MAEGLGGPPGSQIEGVDGSEISRAHRALDPGSQFRTTGSSVPKPTHPQKPFPAFQPGNLCGNLKEINLHCESEVRGGQGNGMLQGQRWELGQPAHS